MEQPPEEAPEVREEEEKEEVAETQGAPELNGGPEHSLPSSSCTGEEGRVGTRAEGHGQVEQGSRPSARSLVGVQSSRVVKDWSQAAGVHTQLCCSAAAVPRASRPLLL